MGKKQFNLHRDIKYSDLVAECTSRLNELHATIQLIPFEASNENIVKFQRLKFEFGELQSTIQILLEQMNLKRNSSHGPITTAAAASQTDEFDANLQLTTIDRTDKSPNTEPILNVNKNERDILQWIREHAKLMRIENVEHLLTSFDRPLPIDNGIKNDARNFVFARTRSVEQNQIDEMEHCKKGHSHLNKFSRIVASYEKEIQKLDRKLQSSCEKYTKIKCCAVILLDIIDHLNVNYV